MLFPKKITFMLEGTPATARAPLPQIGDALQKPPRIAIKAGGRILFLDPAEIVTVEAQGNYVVLQRLSGVALVLRVSLSVAARKLLPYGFVRIHRSALINAAFVEEIRPCATGDFILRIKGGQEFQVSRTFKRNLHTITPLWLGTDGFSDG
jgi:DNA-binding LytR/AlgR family response regulator